MKTPTRSHSCPSCGGPTRPLPSIHSRTRLEPWPAPHGSVVSRFGENPCFGLLVALLAFGVGACTNRSQGQGGDQGGLRLDGGAADALVARRFTFVPDDDGKTSPAITLRLASQNGKPGADDTLQLEVIARGIATLQGVAFRLVLPVGVTLSGSGQAGPEFGVSNAVFRVAQSGSELWLGVGRRGFSGVDASTVERTVATFALRVNRAAATALPFREHHGLVLDSETGRKVEVTWLAGRLEPKP